MRSLSRLNSAVLALAAIGALASPAIPVATRTTIVHERRKKAEKALKKSGRAPVPYAHVDIIEAAEEKRARKAAKAERDLIRTKMGAGR